MDLAELHAVSAREDDITLTDRPTGRVTIELPLRFEARRMQLVKARQLGCIDIVRHASHRSFQLSISPTAADRESSIRPTPAQLHSSMKRPSSPGLRIHAGSGTLSLTKPRVHASFGTSKPIASCDLHRVLGYFSGSQLVVFAIYSCQHRTP